MRVSAYLPYRRNCLKLKAAVNKEEIRQKRCQEILNTVFKLVHAVLFPFNNNIYPSILRTRWVSPADTNKLAKVSLLFF